MKNKVLMGVFFLTAPFLTPSSGQLPRGFKFETPSGENRTSIITQLARYEACQGDEKCLEELKAMENSLHVYIQEGKVVIENASDLTVSFQNKG